MRKKIKMEKNNSYDIIVYTYICLSHYLTYTTKYLCEVSFYINRFFFPHPTSL